MAIAGSALDASAQHAPRKGVWVTFGLVGGPYNIDCDKCAVGDDDKWRAGSDMMIDFAVGAPLTPSVQAGLGFAGTVPEPADGAHYVEAVSFMVVLQYFPRAQTHWWMRGGAGLGMTYLKTGGTRTATYGSMGLSTQLAAGYDWRLGSFGVGPTVAVNLHAPTNNIYRKIGHPARVSWAHFGLSISYY